MGQSRVQDSGKICVKIFLFKYILGDLGDSGHSVTFTVRKNKFYFYLVFWPFGINASQ